MPADVVVESNVYTVCSVSLKQLNTIKQNMLE